MAEVFEGFRIGERVLIDRWKATVKFVGHVHGQQGIWVGLDWDDAERGKHDGSIGAQRCFMDTGLPPSCMWDALSCPHAKQDRFSMIGRVLCVHTNSAAG